MAFAVLHNPFATEFIRPGANSFLCSGDSVEAIVGRFRENHLIGQIVGPHGTGKTTLTFAMEESLRLDFQSIARVVVREHHQVHVDPTSQLRGRSGYHLLVVDGFERLSVLERWLLKRNIRPGDGLLVTTHARVGGLPIIYETKSELATLVQLAKTLCPDRAFDRNYLKSVFEEHQSNIRESLMTLYDEFESSTREA